MKYDLKIEADVGMSLAGLYHSARKTWPEWTDEEVERRCGLTLGQRRACVLKGYVIADKIMHHSHTVATYRISPLGKSIVMRVARQHAADRKVIQ